MWFTPNWQVPENVFAYQTTRLGGNSKNQYASFNVGLHVNDVQDHVLSNRKALPYSSKIQWLTQVHSEKAIVLSKPKNSLQEFHADASISRSSDHVCAVMTADCVPILLAAKNGQEVAAVHAGWQGLVKGVIANTVALMHTQPNQLIAWIGPAISQAHYEIGEEVKDKLTNFSKYLKPNAANKWLADLPGITQFQLNQLGITTVYNANECTYANEGKYFSHRRAQHQNTESTGRMVSVIGILGSGDK